MVFSAYEVVEGTTTPIRLGLSHHAYTIIYHPPIT